MLQCSTVGVNSTLQPEQHRRMRGRVLRGRHSCKLRALLQDNTYLMWPALSSTEMSSSSTTLSCSRL